MYVDFCFWFPYVQLTANNPSILIVNTITIPPVVARTLLQARLATITLHLIHPDSAIRNAKLISITITQSLPWVIAQTVAHYVSIYATPGIITHRTPLTVMEHFNAALVRTTTIHKSDCNTVWCYYDRANILQNTRHIITPEGKPFIGLDSYNLLMPILIVYVVDTKV